MAWHFRKTLSSSGRIILPCYIGENSNRKHNNRGWVERVDRSRRHRLGVKPLKLHGEVRARLYYVLHYLPISSPLTNSTKVSQITSYHLTLTWPVRRSLAGVIIESCDRSLSIYSNGFTYSITSVFSSMRSVKLFSNNVHRKSSRLTNSTWKFLSCIFISIISVKRHCNKKLLISFRHLAYRSKPLIDVITQFDKHRNLNQRNLISRVIISLLTIENWKTTKGQRKDCDICHLFRSLKLLIFFSRITIMISKVRNFTKRSRDKYFSIRMTFMFAMYIFDTLWNVK